MKTSSKFWLISGLAAALVSVAGCSSSDDNGSPQGSADPATVPDSAGTSVASFVAFLAGLDPNDETSEPLLIKDSFAVPPDETSDSQPPT